MRRKRMPINEQPPRGPLVIDWTRADIVLIDRGGLVYRPYLLCVTEVSTGLIVFSDVVGTEEEIPARLWAFFQANQWRHKRVAGKWPRMKSTEP